MPRGNRTGPMGMGARTGRAAGYCAGYNQPGFMGGGFGGNFGRGFFGRRGFRRFARMPMHAGWMGYGAYPGAYPPPAPMTEEQELESLKAEETWLKEQLEAVQSRMKKEE